MVKCMVTCHNFLNLSKHLQVAIFWINYLLLKVPISLFNYIVEFYKIENIKDFFRGASKVCLYEEI